MSKNPEGIPFLWSWRDAGYLRLDTSLRLHQMMSWAQGIISMNAWTQCYFVHGVLELCIELFSSWMDLSRSNKLQLPWSHHSFLDSLKNPAWRASLPVYCCLEASACAQYDQPQKGGLHQVKASLLQCCIALLQAHLRLTQEIAFRMSRNPDWNIT